jgi:hypothetical protein
VAENRWPDEPWPEDGPEDEQEQPCPLNLEQQELYHQWLDSIEGGAGSLPWPLDPAEILGGPEARDFLDKGPLN